MFLLSELLAAALPMSRYIQKYGNAEDREKLRRLTGTREYEELTNIFWTFAVFMIGLVA